jgi:hypothetical protein
MNATIGGVTADTVNALDACGRERRGALIGKQSS